MRDDTPTLRRRPFLAAVAGAVACPRGAAAQPAGDALAAVERTMQDFVADRMVDRDGLCRSALCAATRAPWTNADLDASGQPKIVDMFKNHPDKAGCLAYENALMATGEYAVSQIDRHRATGEAAARERAHRAVRAILAVIDEGRHHAPGWLPKPFCGLARARDSHETSTDQYTKALVALHAWRPFGDDAERRAIDRFFVDAADFFIARDWKFAYRHRTIVTAETHLHALGLYVPLVALAARASGDSRYLVQLARFDGPMTRAAEAAELANFNMTSLIGEGYHVAIEAGLDDPRLPRTIRHLWRLGESRIDASGKASLPARSGGPSAAGAPAAGARRTAVTDWEAPRLAALATLVPGGDAAERDARRAVAEKILLAYDDPEVMTHADLTRCIAEVAITSWLVACWRLRAATG